MDTFFEQIISVKKSLGNIACAVGIWILALPLCFLAYLIIPSLSALLILGILYGAFKLSTMFNIEYEYIVTNGTFLKIKKSQLSAVTVITGATVL